MIHIFLDIDGVLNNYKNYDNDQYGLDINEYNINNFLQLLSMFNSENIEYSIILSSDWKYDLDMVKKLTTNYKFDILGHTERTLLKGNYDTELIKNNNELRRIEISNYIKSKKIKNYLIIDHLLLDIDNYYNISSNKGITEDDIQNIFEMAKNKR